MKKWRQTVQILLTNIGSLDHAYVIPAISNTAHTFLCEMSDKSRNVGFLCGRTSTGYDCRELGRNFNEFCLEHIKTQL